MIVDSSALIAILRQEPDSPDLALAIEEASDCAMAAPTLLEASIVAGPARVRVLDAIISEAQIEIVPFTVEHARIARAAHARYGKGSGSRARLNLGDCISYAVAAAAGESLLFKGDDFTHTDATPALSR